MIGVQEMIGKPNITVLHMMILFFDQSDNKTIIMITIFMYIYFYYIYIYAHIKVDEENEIMAKKTQA